MVGKFLLGMVSGGLVVTGGLVVGSALFPTRPANDNPSATLEEPIAAPAAATSDAGATVQAQEITPDTAETPLKDAAVKDDPEEQAAVAEEAVVEEPAVEEPAVEPAPTEPSVNDDATTAEPAAVAEETAAAPAPTKDTAAETAAEPALDPAPEPAPEPQPEVATATTAPEAPEVLGAEPVDPAAPTAAEVAKPETLAEPSKPAETTADAAAEVPDAPAETDLAKAKPALAEPLADPAPVEPPASEAPAPDTASSDPVAAAETEPLAEPAANPVEPAPDMPDTEIAKVDPTTEPVVNEPAPTADIATDDAAEPAPSEEIVTAEATPAVDPPAAASEAALTELAPAETAPAEPQDAELAPIEPAPADAAPAMEPAPEAPAAETPAPETTEAAPDTAMPGTRPDALPGTLVEPQDPAPEPEAETKTESPTFKPAPGLPRAGEGVIIGRDKATEPDPADPAAVAVDPRPIAQFAAAFENPEAKPPLAIVLIDDGSTDLDRAALAALPFPVSFALDPLDPTSAQHAAAYRAAGKEVVMLVTGIADGAMPADVEVAFQSMEQGLPDAVAVMDLPEPSFQNRRPLAATVVPILKAQGRGLLTWDAGLNAADQVARREDLEAAVIFRDIGSTGADGAAIRRLLDRAVFKAGQDGRVSVVGTADPATVAALLEWSVEGKAATVALAPVTAVLTVE